MQLNTNRPRRDDDSGVAGVIGVVLIIAVLITAYDTAVRTDIPSFGAEAERAWDAEVGSTFRQLSGALSDGLTTGAPLAVSVSPPPEARALEVPLLGRRAPVAAGGTVSFEPSCATLTATHLTQDGRNITDLRQGAGGCVAFRAETIYSDSFAYRTEVGGELRLQGDRAVVLAGPPLELDTTNPNVYRAALGIPGLRGDGSSSTIDNAGVRVDLVPGPHAGEVEQSPNAANATWRLDTPYPAAWKTWFQTRFDQAGFVASRASPGPGQSSADYTLACSPVDCSRGANGLGTLIVTLEGPRKDADDLKLSVTYGIFDVNVR